MSTDGERTVGKQDLSGFAPRRNLSFRSAEVSVPSTTDPSREQGPQSRAESGPGPDDATVSAPGKTPRRKSGASTRKPPSTASTPAQQRMVKFNRSVHIRTELRRQLKQESEGRSLTLTQVVLEAMETHYDQLEKAIAEARAIEAKPSRGTRLFEVDQREYRRDHADRQPITLRLTAHNEQVLDKIQVEVGARNRSDLVEAALILAFGERTPNRG